MKKVTVCITARQDHLGGGERKAQIYFKQLTKYQWIRCYLIRIGKKVKQEGNVIDTTSQKLETALEKVQTDVVFAIWDYDHVISLRKKHPKWKVLLHVNFTNGYRSSVPCLIISKTDYYKLSLLGNDMEKDHVLYNPQEVALWAPKKRPQEGDRLVIGRLARAEPTKWSALFLATLISLNFSATREKLAFSFVGLPRLYRVALKLFVRPSIRKHITLLPEMKDKQAILQWYHSVDVFWQTSKIGESFGNVIAEAFCCGVPVITDVKDFRTHDRANPKVYNAQIELVDHGQNGWYGSYPSVIISTLGGINKGDALRMGLAGRRKVEKNYAASLSARTLASMIQRIMSLEGRRLPLYPTKKEIEAYSAEYVQRMTVSEEVHKSVRWHQWLLLRIWNICWSAVELLYVLTRKVCAQIGIDFERGIRYSE